MAGATDQQTPGSAPGEHPILDELEQLEKAAQDLASRLFPSLLEPTPEVAQTGGTASPPQSPIRARISALTKLLRDLTARSEL